jgi:dynein heavy chain
MYQFSLQWFINLFLNGIDKAEKFDDDLNARIESLRSYFTYSFYSNVCRSLFERHKLTFSLYLCYAIIAADGQLDEDEFRYLLAGPTSIITDPAPNPAPEWLTAASWSELQFVSRSLPKMAGLDAHVAANVAHYRSLFDDVNAHSFALAGDWASKCTPLERLVVTRCLRVDKVMHGVQDFIAHYIGERYVVPPQFNLADAYKDSDNTTPLIFIISPGSDPMSDLLKFAEQMRMGKKLDKVSLGQGQGPRAAEMVKDGMERGTWVLLQNCHLATSWMPQLEQLIENMQPETIKKEFRLWLTSMPSPSFPVPVLQVGVKMTNEPPKGLRANVVRSYFGFKEDDLAHASKPGDFKKLVFAECLFHGVIQERRRFGSLGFNIPYEFNDSDRNVCLLQLRKFLDMYPTVPFEVLRFLSGEINYGGRVTDDWDRRCMMTLIRSFLTPAVLEVGYKFSPSGEWVTAEPGNRQSYLDALNELPINARPEVFGLHENADITSARNDTAALLQTVLSLTTTSSAGGPSNRDATISRTAEELAAKVPALFDLDAFKERYPTKYEESFNTVLGQEAVRYNKLLTTMATTLRELRAAMRGEVILSTELEQMAQSIFVNAVPVAWTKVAYPSLKPLSSWMVDLAARWKFINGWYEHGTPTVFWVGGFFFPQAFLTATLQNYARKIQQAIDTISFSFHVQPPAAADFVPARPERGAIISGLYMEGARWDPEARSIVESRPKELFSAMPMVLLDPVVNREKPKDVYVCPVYKTLTRAGTLSTTGHSTNFVLPIELPTTTPAEHWIRRGVACIVTLDD